MNDKNLPKGFIPLEDLTEGASGVIINTNQIVKVLDCGTHLKICLPVSVSSDGKLKSNDIDVNITFEELIDKIKLAQQ